MSRRVDPPADAFVLRAPAAPETFWARRGPLDVAGLFGSCDVLARRRSLDSAPTGSTIAALGLRTKARVRALR